MRASLQLVLLSGAFALSFQPLCHADAVRLKISGPDGKPVVGASVHVVERSGSQSVAYFEQELNLHSDPVGRVAMESKKPFVSPSPPTSPDDHPFRSLTATITAPHFEAIHTRLQAGDNSVTLRPGRSLSGVILDAAQKPVAGVKIELQQVVPEGISPPVVFPRFEGPTTRSDAKGRWHLEGMPQSGNVELVVAEDTPPWQSDSVWLGVTPKQEAPPIFVQSGATIKGRLLKPDGTPLSGVRIQASNSSLSPTTGADGTFQTVNPYQSTSLSPANGLPFAFSDKDINHLQPGEVRDIGDWRGTEGVHIRGKLVDAATHRSVAGAYVSSFGSTNHGESDTDGVFDFVANSDATSLRIFPDGYVRPPDIALPLAKDGILDAGTILLLVAHNVPGTLRDQSGHPVAALLQAHRTGATQDEYIGARAHEDGSFTFEDIQEGHYTVSVDERTLTAPIAFDVVPDVPTPALQVGVEDQTPTKSQAAPDNAPRTLLTGRVVFKGRPVAGAQIHLDFEGQLEKPQPFTLLSNLDGTFALTLALHDATPKITGVSRPGLPAGSGEFTRANGAWRSTLVLPSPDEALRGRVVDSAGKPVVGAFVGWREGNSFPVPTDSKGEFVLTAVPPTDTTLLASDGPRFSFTNVQKGRRLKIVLPDVPLVADKTALAEQILDATPANDNWNWWKRLDVLGAPRIERILLQHGETDRYAQQGQWTDYLRLLAQREPQTLLSREAELRASVPASAQDELTLQIMLVRATSPDVAEKAKARDYLTQIKIEPYAYTPRDVIAALTRAEIAAHLDETEAAKWLALASTLTGNFAGEDTMVAWGRLSARISPTAWQTLTKNWRPFSQLELLWGAMTYYREQGDAEAARKTLAQMEELAAKVRQSGPEFRDIHSPGTSTDLVNDARYDVARILARTDPQGALRWIETLSPYSQRLTVALIEVAQRALKNNQTGTARKALQTLFEKPFGIKAQAAEIALQFDSQLADKLFSQVYATAISNKFFSPTIVDYAQVRAAKWPGESRILLERQVLSWQAQSMPASVSPYLWQSNRKDLIAVMSHLSPRRALELENQLTDEYGLRAATRAEIALALLAPQ